MTFGKCLDIDPSLTPPLILSFHSRTIFRPLGTAQMISGADARALLSEYDAVALQMSRPHFDLGNFSMASGAYCVFSGIDGEHNSSVECWNLIVFIICKLWLALVFLAINYS